jgi:hypothetical protein
VGIPLIFLAAVSGLTAAHWQDVQRHECTGLDASLRQLPDQPRVLGLDFYRESAYVTSPVFMHMVAYSHDLKGGEVSFSFARFGTGWVVYRDWEIPPWMRGYEWSPQRILDHDDDFGYFDFALMHCNSEAHAHWRSQTNLEPLVQDCAFLSLTPMTITIPLQNALSLQNIRIHVPSTFTVGISTLPEIMQNAAERMLGLAPPEIEDMAREIIFGQLRLTVASLTIEQINTDRESFLVHIRKNVEPELNKIGLYLINVNITDITDITDESDYINSIGKKAASEAINRAYVDVAQQDKIGAVGQAEANREREIKVAENAAGAEKGKKQAEAASINRRISSFGRSFISSLLPREFHATLNAFSRKRESNRKGGGSTGSCRREWFDHCSVAFCQTITTPIPKLLYFIQFLPPR